MIIKHLFTAHRHDKEAKEFTRKIGLLEQQNRKLLQKVMQKQHIKKSSKGILSIIVYLQKHGWRREAGCYKPALHTFHPPIHYIHT